MKWRRLWYGYKEQDVTQSVSQELSFSSQEALSSNLRFKQVAIYFQREDSCALTVSDPDPTPKRKGSLNSRLAHPKCMGITTGRFLKAGLLLVYV